MKNYLSFQLTGKQFLPLWIVFYLFFIIPYAILMYMVQPYNNEVVAQKPTGWFFVILFLLIIFGFTWTFYITRMMVRNLTFKDLPINEKYKFIEYLEVFLGGLLLTIVTIGIYSPWFVRNLQRFFIDNASYHENAFSFQGNGGKLFVILLLTLILPMILLTVLMMGLFGKDFNSQFNFTRIIYQGIIYLVLIPYMYFLYKWMVDIKYKEYHIKWNTDTIQSIGKIAIEVLLSMITFGIYLPMAYLRLYKYFSEKTESNVVDNQRIKFGFDTEQKKDFLTFWGQILLTIITVGIYFPWAFCRITKLFVNKTYMEKVEV